MTINGNKFEVIFGTSKAKLHFQNEASMTFTIAQKDGVEVNSSETVAIKMTEIRPNLFMVTWKEESGTTVTQVHDYENEIVYSNWTLPTGEFKNFQGTIKEVGK